MLDTTNVPPEIALLLPIAEKWGIGDDYERESAIERASLEQLQQLAGCLDEIDDATLVAWLTGPESKKQSPTDEYLAVTCLTMAVHSAKTKLKKRRRT